MEYGEVALHQHFACPQHSRLCLTAAARRPTPTPTSIRRSRTRFISAARSGTPRLPAPIPGNACSRDLALYGGGWHPGLRLHGQGCGKEPRDQQSVAGDRERRQSRYFAETHRRSSKRLMRWSARVSHLRQIVATGAHVRRSAVRSRAGDSRVAGIRCLARYRVARRRCRYLSPLLQRIDARPACDRGRPPILTLTFAVVGRQTAYLFHRNTPFEGWLADSVAVERDESPCHISVAMAKRMPPSLSDYLFAARRQDFTASAPVKPGVVTTSPLPGVTSAMARRCFGCRRRCPSAKRSRAESGDAELQSGDVHSGPLGSLIRFTALLITSCACTKARGCAWSYAPWRDAGSPDAVDLSRTQLLACPINSCTARRSCGFRSTCDANEWRRR